MLICINTTSVQQVLMSANAIIAADSATRKAELEAMETSWEGVTRIISK